MAYVVTEPCIGKKDRSCVEVCPVDCFYNNPDSTLNEKVGRSSPREKDTGMLIINPEECIHCGACEPECPVEAIYEDDDVPQKWSEYIQLNARVASQYEERGDKELDANRVTSKE